jgi:hypothetical protein
MKIKESDTNYLDESRGTNDEVIEAPPRTMSGYELGFGACGNLDTSIHSTQTLVMNNT